MRTGKIVEIHLTNAIDNVTNKTMIISNEHKNEIVNIYLVVSY